MAEFEKYCGTYRCAKEQDYEKFLTTMGVSWPMRKMATMFTREFEVLMSTFKFSFPFLNHLMYFR